eukprot:snap_masked-scaffold_15-processed-gene-6.33-mRNA-1 protein AED:0.04 eAED:0.04 QI:0/0/0/1/1/1/2/0/224
MQNTPLDWYRGLPLVTRTYVTFCFITSSLTTMDMISAFHLYFNLNKILQGQIYRLVTPFVYFGDFSLDFAFSMYFTIRYLRSLEESSFSNRTLDFLWLILYGAFSTLLIAPFLKENFLSRSLTFMVIYIWGRKNPHMTLSLLGLLTFKAPYVAFVLCGMSLLFGQPLGLNFIGHFYFYMDDIFPQVADLRRWKKRNYLRAPKILKDLVQGRRREPEVEEIVMET